LWCSAASQFGTNFGWIFIMLFLPRYLDEVHHLTVVERGWLSGLPTLIGLCGMLAGGWLTDRLTRAVGLRWGRRLPMALTRFVAMGAYLSLLAIDSPGTATAAFCLVALATDLGTASVWAFKQDIGGRYVGAVLGWGNMWGNIGAAVSPIALTLVIGEGRDSRWDLGFIACATAFAIAGIAALGVDATRPLRTPEG
jgi:nitrate/nitrite transporter NarK